MYILSLSPYIYIYIYYSLSLSHTHTHPRSTDIQVNLPQADSYSNSSPVSALLTQFLIYRGFWRQSPIQKNSKNSKNSKNLTTNSEISTKNNSNNSNNSKDSNNLTWKWVKLSNKIQFIAACNPPRDAGRVVLPPPLLRKSIILYIDFPEPASLVKIYGTQLEREVVCMCERRGLWLQGVKTHIGLIARAMVEVWRYIHGDILYAMTAYQGYQGC